MNIRKTITLCFTLSLLALTASEASSTTVYLIGDSTMAPKKESKRPETGWGEMLPKYFIDEIKFINKARNGRSTRTFMEEERWDTVVNSLKKGDYVFIQFGHNDQSKHKVDRYTPPDQYKNNLIRFVEETREKEATPILLTPIVRRRFDESGKFYDVHGVYPNLVREIADEYNVVLIDHHKLSEEVLIEYGVEKSEQLFLHLQKGESENYPDGLEDNTHFSPQGAILMAKLAVSAIENLQLRLKNYFKN